jgi:hypothetical protein
VNARDEVAAGAGEVVTDAAGVAVVPADGVGEEPPELPEPPEPPVVVDVGLVTGLVAATTT